MAWAHHFIRNTSSCNAVSLALLSTVPRVVYLNDALGDSRVLVIYEIIDRKHNFAAQPATFAGTLYND